METKEIIMVAATAVIALATVCYTIFSGITISKLNKQNNLLLGESYNKLASFLREEWRNAGFDKIVAKLKNYPSHEFIKSLGIDDKLNSPKQIDFYNSIELLTRDELGRVVELTKKLNVLIKENKINIYTVLLYFEFLYGDTDWACNEDFNMIIYCIKDLYPSNIKNEKIKIINDFYSKAVKARHYNKLAQSIKKNII